MESSYTISSKCRSYGCNNNVEPYNIEKQKIHPSGIKFRLCSKCKITMRNRNLIEIKCVLCDNKTDSILKKFCDDCKPGWLKVQQKRYHLKRYGPKGKCLQCKTQLTRDEHKHKHSFCSDKCARTNRYIRWKLKHLPPRPKCLNCNIQLTFQEHKNKKKYCSYSCWGEGYYKDRKQKGLYKRKTIEL
jgi:hypothetical protein